MQPNVILPRGYTPINVAWANVTGKEISVAADYSHTPNWLIASLYKAGYRGDPMRLGITLEYWFNQTGGVDRTRALAAYRAGSPTGALNKTDLAWATQVIHDGENLPRNLQGALDTGSILAISTIVVGGLAAPIVAVGGGAADTVITGVGATEVETAITGAGVFGNLVLGLWDAAGSAWTWMVDGLSWLGSGLEGFAGQVLGGFSHVIENLIPGAIKTALGDAVKWGEGFVGKELGGIRGLISGGQRLLSDALHSAEHSLGSKIDGVLGRISGIVHWFDTGAKHAVDLVLHPDRLLVAILKGVSAPVVWLAAHTLLPVIVAVLRDSRTLVGNVVRDLETILADLL